MSCNHSHLATERRSFEEILSNLPQQIRWARVVLQRLNRITEIPHGAVILDIGSANGEFLAACNQLGYNCKGIEPWREARRNTAILSEMLGVPLICIDGRAESIPFDSETFDIVHASEVMEHVADIDQAIAEVYRVLKRGGIFWFSSASSMCPVQHEIRGFPLFGWYPQRLKQRIMVWARDEKPDLVGYTQTPAINWFTPWKAREQLKRAGFIETYDRWDLRGLDEGNLLYSTGLRLIRSTKITKVIADIMVPSCSYAALK